MENLKNGLIAGKKQNIFTAGHRMRSMRMKVQIRHVGASVGAVDFNKVSIHFQRMNMQREMGTTTKILLWHAGKMLAHVVASIGTKEKNPVFPGFSPPCAT